MLSAFVLMGFLVPLLCFPPFIILLDPSFCVGKEQAGGHD